MIKYLILKLMGNRSCRAESLARRGVGELFLINSYVEYCEVDVVLQTSIKLNERRV